MKRKITSSLKIKVRPKIDITEEDAKKMGFTRKHFLDAMNNKKK